MDRNPILMLMVLPMLVTSLVLVDSGRFAAALNAVNKDTGYQIRIEALPGEQNRIPL